MFLPRINALSYCIIGIKYKFGATISIELSDINLGNYTDAPTSLQFCLLRLKNKEYDSISFWVIL